MVVTTAVDKWLQVQKYPKMITLTLKHTDDPLQLQIKKLYDSFRKLRRRAYFQRLITGGVWFFQLKYYEGSEEWHPHIHCLVAGKFLPHARLKSLWHSITGDSYVVDIRPVKDIESASTEVARYATSPADIARMPIEQAIDVYYSTKGKRICGSWGTAKKVTLKPTPQDDGDMWVKVADFYFVNVQKEYSKIALQFWKCYKRGDPYDGPEIQKESEVYRAEADAMLAIDFKPESYVRFQQRLRRNATREWKTFFDEKEG